MNKAERKAAMPHQEYEKYIDWFRKERERKVQELSEELFEAAHEHPLSFNEWFRVDTSDFPPREDEDEENGVDPRTGYGTQFDADEYSRKSE